jgi:hypothetical protein
MTEQHTTLNGKGGEPTQEHLRWLVDSRSKNQRVTLELYLTIKHNSISINKDIRLAYLAQELAAVAFSLWRAVFLSDLSEEVEKQMINVHVENFLHTLIADNTIGYQQDLRSREWTFPYYLKNARSRLLDIARQGPFGILDLNEIDIEATSAKEDWTIAHEALSKAVERFAEITKPR